MRMVSTSFIIVISVLLQIAVSLVEFEKSILYDETDFAVPEVVVPTFASRIYVSVPEASVEIAKKILVHDYMHGSSDRSLYAISTLLKGTQKGYFEIEDGIDQIKILNKNPGFATAPIAVWVLHKDAIGFTNGRWLVYEAANLISEPHTDGFEMATIMSAEPFTLRTKTDGPMTLYTTLSGYDSNINPDRDDCTYVVWETDRNAYMDIQASVMSPLISMHFDGTEYFSTTTLSASIGIGNSLDFSGFSFAASPGYNGCKGNKTYRSSLYNATTSFKYSSTTGSYDVTLNAFMHTDSDHPVNVKDQTNGKSYRLFGNFDNDKSQNTTLRQTNNLEISWTRNEKDLDQSFVVQVMPSK